MVKHDPAEMSVERGIVTKRHATRAPVRKLTFALCEVGDLAKSVPDGRDDLVVHVEDRTAVLGEAGVVEEEPVEQHEGLPHQLHPRG